MNLEKLTLEKCVDEYENGTTFFINDGKVIGYENEKVKERIHNGKRENKSI